MDSNAALSVFVTGASGFFGRVVTRALVAGGHSVCGQTNGSSGAAAVREDGGLPCYSDLTRAGEIKSMLTLAKADVVVHMATQAFNHIPHRNGIWDEDFLQRSTAAVLEAAQAAGVKLLILPTFAFIYGDTKGEWVDETAPRKGDLVHAGKIEDLVLKSGVGTVLRCGYVYGAGSEALKAVATALRNGRSVTLGSDTACSNWIHAQDLASAVTLAATQQLMGEIFNIVDDTPTSPAQFIANFAESLGLSAPSRGMSFFNRPGKVQAALLERSVQVKNDKAKQKLGWTLKYPNSKQGLDQVMVEWRAQTVMA
jgi:nucleoside-diphosphate-sugar epimerase